MSEAASGLTAGERRAVADAGRVWWLFLITGTLWLILSIVVFRFDWTTVSAISILFGIVMLAAGVMELAALAMTDGWWKLLHGLLGVAFVVIGILSFIHPGDTFKALAAVMSFYFIFKGTFDIVAALATRLVNELWWLGLLLGIVEVVVGFWAAGDFGRKTILLVVWVGIVALTRGVSEIMFAFVLRHARSAA